MTLVYRDSIGYISVELSAEDTITFFDGYMFCITANNEFLKVKTSDILELIPFK